jgi:hypothetical protein
MSGLNQISGSCNCASGVTCVTCSPAAIPHTLSVTDALGTYTATWNGSTYWVTPALQTGTVSPVANCTGGTAACASSSQNGTAIYYYLIGCVSAGQMAIFRQYYYLSCSSPASQYVPYGCNPGAASFGESFASPVSVTCGSIAWSGTLTPTSGATLADPVGGTVSFSQ